jgi:o-succinylbenzoate synthase
MKITDILLQKIFIEFKYSYGISSASFSGEHFLVLKLVGENGVFGISDSVTSIPFGYEDVGTMIYIIKNYLFPAIEGMHSFDMEAIETRMAQATPGHPMAKAAINIALHDLNARILGMPLYQLLGGKYYENIATVGGVGISNTERMIHEASNFVKSGCKTIKMKIGTDPQTDLERVREVRNAIGADINFRVDANQGCNLSDYLPTFRKMENFNLEFLEQPLPSWDLDGYQKLCAALDMPVLIDEGVYTPHDLITLIKLEAVDAVNIKILKTGLTGGKRIAAIAESAGLPCLVGSMFETGIGTSASLHFAASTRNVTHTSECGFPTVLKEDVIEGGIFSELPESYRWDVPKGMGLGVTLNSRVDLGLVSVTEL